jgi:hypothetical protein
MIMRKERAAMTRTRVRLLPACLLLVAIAAGAAALPAPAGAEQPSFATPDAALAAPREAIQSGSGGRLLALFGPENRDELIGGGHQARTGRGPAASCGWCRATGRCRSRR